MTYQYVGKAIVTTTVKSLHFYLTSLLGVGEKHHFFFEEDDQWISVTPNIITSSIVSDYMTKQKNDSENFRYKIFRFHIKVGDTEIGVFMEPYNSRRTSDDKINILLTVEEAALFKTIT